MKPRFHHMFRSPILALLSLLWLSPQAGTAAECDLEAFIGRVRQHSKELKLAEKEVELAGALKAETKSMALPHLSAQAGYTRNLKDTYMYADLSALTGDEGGTQKMRINRDNEFQAGVSLSQVLFSGSVFKAIQAARQYEDLTDFVYDATYEQIITGARQAFYQTLLLREFWEVARGSEANALENYEDIAKAFANGLVSEFALLQAETRYRETIPATTGAQRNYELALISLKNLAGLPSDSTLVILGSLADYPDMPSLPSLTDILERRPDYNALQMEERLRGTQISAERAGYFPTLSGVAAYGYSAQSDELALDDENHSVTVGLALSVPIFNGGETRARVSQAVIGRDQTRLVIQKKREAIEKEVQSVRLQLEEARSRIESSRKALETAGKAFSIAENTTRAGLTTQLELKDSRVVLDQATVTHYSAVFDYLQAYFEWQRVIGEVQE